MKQVPKIEKFMTKTPHSVNGALPLSVARDLMKKYSIRHLPVLERGKLVGVITDRDLKLSKSLGDDSFSISELMSFEPFAVSPDTPLEKVLDKMVKHKYGCAVVMRENGETCGIFTAIDGLASLKKMLNAKTKRSPANARSAQ